jgi:hypothetical protein
MDQQTTLRVPSDQGAAEPKTDQAADQQLWEIGNNDVLIWGRDASLSQILARKRENAKRLEG